MILNKHKIISITTVAIASCTAFGFALLNDKSKANHTVPPTAIVQEDGMEVITIHANTKTYSSPDELANRAQVILIGRPTKEFNERKHVVNRFPSGDIESFYTLTDIEVEKVLKQPKDTIKINDVISVVEPVSKLEQQGKQQKIKIEGYNNLMKSSRYLLYLAYNANHELYVLTEIGKYNLDGTDRQDSMDQTKNRFKQEILKKFDKDLK